MATLARDWTPSRSLVGGGSAHGAIRGGSNPAARLRLFCLPYAGGGASLFREWAGTLPPAIHVCPVQLPGREDRIRDRPHTSLEALVDELTAAVLPHLDRPYAVFGHSMGGLIAFELACELRRRGVAPLWLFVSACRAPHRQVSRIELSMLPDAAFVEGVQRKYGGIPEAVLRTPELLEFLMPVLRADLSIVETYSDRREPPLPCAISAFGGIEDSTLSHDELLAWRERTVGPFECRMLPGGHFFVRDSAPGLLQTIEERLRAWT